MSRPVQSCKAISIASVVLFGSWFAFAQNPQLEEKVMALIQKQEINKQKLAQVHLAGDGNNQHQG